MTIRTRLHLAAAVGAVALAACDASPPSAVSPSSESQGAEPATTASAAELREALGEPDTFARARRLADLIPTLDPEAIPEVKAILEDPTLDLGGTEIDLLVRFWADQQPEEATIWAIREAPSAYSVAAVLAAMPVWAAADPEAAQAATKRWVTAPEVAEALQTALIRGWYQADPDGLARKIPTMQMGIKRQSFISSYLRNLVQQKGPEAAMRWAEAQAEDDPVYKLAVYRKVASVLALFDRDATLRWCEAHCDGPYGNNLRNIIARRWVWDDGAAAMAWLSTAPEGAERDHAVRRAFSVWSQNDREAALAWMASQTQGGEVEPWLQPVLPVYTRVLAQTAPEDAITWAERIEGDETRKWALINVARIWRQQDEAAAEAWLSGSPLSEESRELARSQRGRGPTRTPPSHQPNEPNPSEETQPEADG